MAWEIRWFFHGNAASIMAWFETLFDTKLESQKPRDDYYLHIPQCDFAGVKYREERLEIKWRDAYDLNFIGCSGKVKGKAESWARWEWTDPQSSVKNIRFLAEDPIGPTIKVTKKRLQYKYEFAPDGSILPASKVMVENGGAIELTELITKGEQWYSIAIELVGNKSTDKRNLQQSVDHLFREYSGPGLNLENSLGYPEYLAHVTKS